jgi:hypothetical protein
MLMEHVVGPARLGQLAVLILHCAELKLVCNTHTACSGHSMSAGMGTLLQCSQVIWLGVLQLASLLGRLPAEQMSCGAWQPPGVGQLRL